MTEPLYILKREIDRTSDSKKARYRIAYRHQRLDGSEEIILQNLTLNLRYVPVTAQELRRDYRTVRA